MAKKLSLKEKGFCKDFIETKNGTEAAFKNYNVKSRANAGGISAHNLAKPRILNEIDRLMEEQQITEPFLMKTLKEGLKATVVSNFKGDVEETEIPDHDTRHKFFQDAAKMKGWMKEQVDIRSMNIDIELEDMSKEELSNLLKGLLKNITTNNDNNINRGK
jgi:phage terminase small subunit